MVAILSAVVSIFAFRFAAAPRWNLSLLPFNISWPSCADSGSGGLSFISRPAPVGVALPDLAASHRCDDTGQAVDRGAMASQRLPAPLALAITPSGRPKIGTEIRAL